jgi:hypothetical protein
MSPAPRVMTDALGQSVRIAEAAEQIALSRIYAGIHYRSDIEQGLALGRKVAGLVIRRAQSDGAPDHGYTDGHAVDGKVEGAMAHCGHARRYQSSIALSHENQELLASFGKSYWEFYGALRAYQKSPSAAGRGRVRFQASAP